MWIVVRDWGYETSVDVFRNKKEALDYFDEWAEISDAQIYLAKVDKTFNLPST
ncbi:MULTISPECIES: hypothetical protein [Sporosarcina]|uniref:hypothetical protein n=1 Tax=Sporosarcina TaxID=1569 RepID=UPI0030FAFDED